jgi:hypothetical protein
MGENKEKKMHEGVIVAFGGRGLHYSWRGRRGGVAL